MRIYKENQELSQNYNDLIAHKEKKAIFFLSWAVIATIVSLLLLIQNTIIAGYPKSQGYVIEIAPDGSASTDTDAITLLEKWTPKDATINYFLRSFITNLRSVSSDTQINNVNVNRLYKQILGHSIAEDKAKAYLDADATNPNKRARQETVQITIASIVPLSSSSYQIDFRETVWASGRRLTSDNHYKAVVHTEIYTPRNIQQSTFNPIGLYITDFDISLVKEI